MPTCRSCGVKDPLGQLRGILGNMIIEPYGTGPDSFKVTEGIVYTAQLKALINAGWRVFFVDGKLVIYRD